jgi:hypothetical protein
VVGGDAHQSARANHQQGPFMRGAVLHPRLASALSANPWIPTNGLERRRCSREGGRRSAYRLRARGAAGDPRRRLPPRRRSRLEEIAIAGMERKGDLREEDKERERETVNKGGGSWSAVTGWAARGFGGCGLVRAWVGRACLGRFGRAWGVRAGWPARCVPVWLGGCRISFYT